MSVISRKQNRVARHRRIRRKVSGTPARPRMAVMVSNKHTYVQLIDDTVGRTLAAASNDGGDGVSNNVEGAKELGRQIAGKATEQGITKVVIDRGGFRYHGRVRAIVEAASEAGLVAGAREEK